MICYRCGVEADRHNSCPNCGADIRIFQKAIHISNAYYNVGLQKASVRDLSGAIVSLKNSLKFNKYNIDARNLLGLVYYEMGEVVDALSEWVISFNYKKEDNIAERYLEGIHENRARLQECNQTIKKYNQALLYCRQDSRDLAIIQLKKVLALNPKLVKAHQLLALLYMQEDRLEQAKKTLRNAGKIDANNTITLRYLKEVNHRMKEKGTNKKAKDDDLISYQSGNEMIIMPKRFKESSLGATLAYVVIGLVVGVAATAFLIVPGVKRELKAENSQKLSQANETIANNSTTIENLQTQVENLQTQLNDALNKPEEVPEQASTYEALLNGYIAYAAADIYNTGVYLEKVKVEYLSESARAIYAPMWEAVATPYYQQVYDMAYQSYNTDNYNDAIEKFLKLVTVDPNYNEGNAAYYLAHAYRKNGNLEAALPYYQYIVENYPGTERANTAANYINQE